MSNATMTTSEGDIVLELFDEDAPKTVEQLQGARRQGLLRRADLPPHHPGLHDPGRLPAGHRHRRPRLHVRGRVQRPQGRPRRARHGQRRAEHQRLAVLHRHRRRGAVARRQAHRLRPGHRRAWTSSTSIEGAAPDRRAATARRGRSTIDGSLTVHGGRRGARRRGASTDRQHVERSDRSASVEQQPGPTARRRPARRHRGREPGDRRGHRPRARPRRRGGGRAGARRRAPRSPAGRRSASRAAAHPAPRPEVGDRQRRPRHRRRSSPRPARPTRTRSSPRSSTAPTRSASGPSTRQEYLADERVKSASAARSRARSSSCATARSGLVGVIGPWNYPLTNSFGDCIPALAAGNAVILKPSEVTPLTLAAAGRGPARVRPARGRLPGRHRAAARPGPR